jgi:cell division protein FtsA
MYMKNTNVKQQYSMAIDIGTTKIAILVGTVINGCRTIVVNKSVLSSGVVRGVVANVDETERSIKRCLDDARKEMADKAIDFDAVRNNVNIGIAGEHIRTTSESIKRVLGKNTRIDAKDIVAMQQEISKMALKAGEQILHVIPQGYRVDGRYVACDEIVGNVGSKIEANYLVNIADEGAINRIKDCVQRCGLTVGRIILEPLASAAAVLSPDERQVGVAVVDIGGGTSDMAIYCNNELRAVYMLDFAGEYVTTYIADTYRIPRDQAEIMKVKHGNCVGVLNPKDKDETWTFPTANTAEPSDITVAGLADIIRRAMGDIIDAIAYRIMESGCDIKHLVITGGGAALTNLEPFIDARGEQFKTHIGVPYVHTGGERPTAMHPRYATAVGLVFANNLNKGDKNNWRGKVKGLWGDFKKVAVDNVFNEPLVADLR